MDKRRGHIFYFRCIICNRLAKVSMDLKPLDETQTDTYQTLCANCFWNHVITIHGPNIMRDVDAKGQYEDETPH